MDNEQLYTALRNAHAAGDVEGARKLAAYIQTQPTEQVVEKPKGGDPSLSDDPLRTVALVGKAAAQGILSLPMLLADAPKIGERLGRAGFDWLTGNNTPAPPQSKLQSEQLGEWFDKAGAYSPETKGERLLTDVVQGASGAAMGGPAKAPITTLLSGGAAGLGSGAVREGGGGPVAQIAAALAAGSAVPAVTGAAGMVGRGVRNVVDPMLPGGAERAAGRLANDVAGTKREDVVKALLQSQSNVPGLRQNAGQASVPAGSAEFAALQKVADEFKPSPAAALESSQEAARRAAIQSIGQDKSALEAAIAQRAADAKVNYGAAYQQQIAADPALAQIASNPYFKDALPEAFKMAKAKGINPKTDMTEFLQGVKLVLDDKLRKAGEGALGDSQKKLVAEVKSDLVNWLGTKNQAYDKARTEFAAASKPINQMEVGQFLEGKLVSPLENADRAGVFAGAMRDAPRTIKSATGQNMYDDLGQVLTPKQNQTANAVLGDLKNDAVYKDLASKGMTATRKAVGEFSDPIHSPNILSRAAMVANAIIRRIEGKGSKVTMNSLAELSQDPQKLAQVMKATTPAERQTLIEAMTKVAAGAAGAQQ